MIPRPVSVENNYYQFWFFTWWRFCFFNKHDF